MTEKINSVFEKVFSDSNLKTFEKIILFLATACLLYTSDAADE